MTITQNNTWMRFLVLGISLMLLISSCAKTEYTKDAEFHFINATNYSITYKQGFETYNLKPNEIVIISKTQTSGKKPNNDYNVPFFDEYGVIDPFIVKFDSNRCILHTPGTEHSLLNIDSYANNGQTGKRKYKFTYTFTEADYNRATICQ